LLCIQLRAFAGLVPWCSMNVTACRNFVSHDDSADHVTVALLA